LIFFFFSAIIHTHERGDIILKKDNKQKISKENNTETFKINKKLKRKNRFLNFLVHVLLFIFFILIGVVLGDYLYSKDYLRIFKIKKTNCIINNVNMQIFWQKL
jgi:cytoskeletal protein RodZ